MLCGNFIRALSAGPSSPEKPPLPCPRNCTDMPRLRVYSAYEMVFHLHEEHIWPSSSNRTSYGSLSRALFAGPPSPLKPFWPFPATVVIFPPATRRIRWLKVSQIYSAPPGPHTTPNGPFILASSAFPPSPEYPCTPVPAIVTMVAAFKFIPKTIAIPAHFSIWDNVCIRIVNKIANFY